MIDRREILEAASAFSLLPNIVEKDYVLGWMLAGINAHDELGESWVFKGGTCLKKCYFETYRFSEDLDFTLRNEEDLDEEFLQTAFEEVIAWVTEQSGLNIPADQLEFDIYDNSRGRPNCQGKIASRGPVSPTSGGWPKINLDLTADERLVLPSIRREVFHPYSEASNLKLYHADMEAIRRHDPFSNEGRPAVVAPGNTTTFGLARMYQSMMDSAQFEVFRSMLDALAWLGLKETILQAAYKRTPSADKETQH